MSKIFISYRRDDNKYMTARLHDRLVKAFGKKNVFFDIDKNIRAGDKWADVLEKRLKESDILLVVIGKKWAEIMKERQDSPIDWTRFEVLHGLERGESMIVIPIFLEDTRVPSDLIPSVVSILEHQILSS